MTVSISTSSLNKHKPTLLLYFKKLFGAPISPGHSQPGKKLQWEIKIGRQEARPLLQFVNDYGIVMVPQAKCVLDFIQKYVCDGVKNSSATKEENQKLRDDLANLNKKTNQVSIKSERFTPAYLAGTFDMGGCIMFEPNHGNKRAQSVLTFSYKKCKPMLLAIQQFLKRGNIYEGKNNTTKLICKGTQAEEVMAMLAPFAFEQKAQIELILGHRKSFPSGTGKDVSDDEITAQNIVIQQVRNAKQSDM